MTPVVVQRRRYSRPMIRRIAAAALCFLIVPSTVRPQPPAPIRGFTAKSTGIQRQVEEKFRAIPKPENNREYMRAIAAEPHHAGTPVSRKVAESAVSQFKSWGLNASIETFEAPMPHSDRAHRSWWRRSATS